MCHGVSFCFHEAQDSLEGLQQRPIKPAPCKGKGRASPADGRKPRGLLMRSRVMEQTCSVADVIPSKRASQHPPNTHPEGKELLHG